MLNQTISMSRDYLSGLYPCTASRKTTLEKPRMCRKVLAPSMSCQNIDG